MKLKIYLFRHGLTHYNKHHWFTGQIDSKMTPAGRKNARKIARQLKNKQIDVAYHSSLSRSTETLQEVLRYHPKCQEIIEDDRLIERNYGKLQRHSHAQFLEEIERTITHVMEKKYGKMPSPIKKEFGDAVARVIYNLYHRSYDIPPPEGESLKMVEQRVLSFIKDLLRKMKKQKINVAIAAHGNSMRPFRRYFEHLTVEEMLDLNNPWDSYFEYTVEIT